MIRTFTLAFALMVVATLATGAENPGRSRGNDDQERARSAFQRGEILSIAQILALVPRYLAGDVIEVELDERRGQFYYEITVLTPTGRVRELVLNARTGAFVRIED